jgi:hypothetical protein
MLKVLGCAISVLALASVSLAADLSSRSIRGHYIEARTADVFTGACVANGEAEQVGREAVFGWQIQSGAWNGVNLAGLSVVGVVTAEHTLGLRSEPVNPTRAVIIVDSRANAEQRRALEAFAKSAGAGLLHNVVKVQSAPIELWLKDGNVHTATARLTAGELAAVETRAMGEDDHVCGNEEVWYPPLTNVEHAMPAYTLENSYQGEGLDQKWNNRLKRSGFVGTFRLPAA